MTPILLGLWLSSLLSLSVGTWAIAVVTAVITGLIGQFVVGYNAFRKLRAEKQNMPVRERTVAAEEAESALRMLGATAENLRSDLTEERAMRQSCENWRREHLNICPLRLEGRRRHGE